jgi:predicted anti-sigma-YlaC factor YlaD
MFSCADLEELLSPYLDGELEEEQSSEVRHHLEGCEDCAGLVEAVAGIIASGAEMAGLEPPEHLAGDLAASPCRRWLGLLFQAVDHEISQHNLERLLTHLEGCSSCRRSWQDLTLIHQVSEAIGPSQYLLKRCIAAREQRPRLRPILNRRIATAAAYVLAVVTSLVIGNPVTLARSGAGETVERVAEVVGSGVSDVAEQGRGEARVMMWRLWKWGENTVEAVRDFIGGSGKEDDTRTDTSATEQGASS